MTDSARPPAAGTTLTRKPTGVAYARLADLLWQERQTLEDLLFRLVEQQLVLSSGSTRWLPRADDEVATAARDVQNRELIRAAEEDALVGEGGLPPLTSLAELAAHAPQPWQLVLEDHRTVLRELTAEIDAVTAENRRMLRAGELATRAALDQLTGHSRETQYNPRSRARTPFLLDERA